MPRLPQREAMAKCREGAALDRRRCWEAEGFQSSESLQAFAALRATLTAHHVKYATRNSLRRI
jgi:hypothetical protein